MLENIVNQFIKNIKLFIPIVLTIVGTLAVVVGELDDSPGLGGIGIILIVFATYLNFKFKFKE